MSDIPDIEVARYALRTFNVTSGRLMPVAMTVDAWKDGVCQAECVPNPWTNSYSGLGALAAVLGYDTPVPAPDHDAPADGCHCGIYGCLTIDRLKRQYPVECMSIVAVIAVEGNTIIGEIGLRTQAARIVAYWSPEKDVRKICAETCGGAKGFAALDDMLAAFGFEPEGRVVGLSLDDMALLLTPPRRPRFNRLGRISYRITIAVAVINLAFFIAGLFTSAEMSEQLANLGGAVFCGAAAMLSRRNLRRAGA